MRSASENEGMTEPLPPSISRCAIYTRQSRTRPDGVISSCVVQRSICEDFANQQSLVLAEENFDDAGQSSESLDRPALKRLLQKIESGEIDRVVIYSIDRLTRKLHDLHRLFELFERHGVELSVVTDPSFGESAAHRLTFNIIAAASEFQMEMTRERMADSRAALKRQGRRVAGRVPFGYRTDPATKQLTIHEAEAVMVRRMFELAADGTRPQEIADRFNQEQVAGVGGKISRWTARQVLKMLSNPIYAGSIHNGDDVLPGRHEAIINPVDFDQIRKSIESRRSRTPGRGSSKINWPLRGLLVCGACGRVMSPSISGYKNFRYRYYRCRSRAFGRPPCQDVAISAYEIEKFVCTMLSREAGENSEPAFSAFASVWRGLDEMQQMKSLPGVVKQIVFDPQGGKINVSIADGAMEHLNRN